MTDCGSSVNSTLHSTKYSVQPFSILSIQVMTIKLNSLQLVAFDFAIPRWTTWCVIVLHSYNVIFTFLMPLSPCRKTENQIEVYTIWSKVGWRICSSWWKNELWICEICHDKKKNHEISCSTISVVKMTSCWVPATMLVLHLDTKIIIKTAAQLSEASKTPPPKILTN